MRRVKAMAFWIAVLAAGSRRARFRPAAVCDTGLKKCTPTSRPGIRQLVVELFEHDRRGVGRQDGARLHARFDAREQFVLGVGVLEDGLDDHVRAGHAVAGDVRGHARHELGGLAGILEALLESLARALHRRLDELELAILQASR